MPATTQEDDPGINPEDGNQESDESSPVQRKRRIPGPSSQSLEESSNSCPICLEPWTNYGSHRICCLRCGHLFGLECIRRWLSTSSNDRCPNCNKKARRNDIRLLYVRRLTAVDNAELEAIKEGCNLEKKRRLTAEREIAGLRMYIEDLGGEIKYLRRREASMVENDTDQRDLWHYEAVGRVALPSGDNARYRVMAQFDDSLVVSRRSVAQQTNIFAGFGVRKFNTADYGSVDDIHLHGGVIRDLAFQPASSNLLLSVGFDKCAKITDLSNKLVLLSFPSPTALWSCCWNELENQYFYTGSSNGIVEVFDLRNPRSYLRQLQIDNPSPVNSLHFDYKERTYSVLAGQSQSLSFHIDCQSDHYRRVDCPLNSMISSVAFDRESRYIVTTYKQSTTSSQVNRLELYEIDKMLQETGYRGPSQVFCNPGSGPLVQKSALFPRPNYPDDLIICSSDQQTPRMNVFSTGCPHFMRQVPVDSAPLDIMAYGSTSPTQKDLLAVLNSKSLQIFRLSQKE